jgi:uncharacterized protein (TIGR02466 family)
VDKNDLEQLDIFPSAVFVVNVSEYIDVVRKVSSETLKTEKTIHELYPVVMSADFTYDERVSEFAQYVIQTAYNIMVHQGYNMNARSTVFQSMWMQEHHKTSGMEKHIHNNGAQLVGFYFLDTPEESCRLILHDPRVGKVQNDLTPADSSAITLCSDQIFYTPKQGDLVFTNAWLPHSFTRHGNDEPMRFVHINIAVQDTPEQAKPEPIII